MAVSSYPRAAIPSQVGCTLTLNRTTFFHRFAKQLGESIAVTLLTNDRANLALAKEANIPVMTIHSYIESVSEQYPDLAELLAPEVSTSEGDADHPPAGKKSARRQGGQRVLLYQEHKPMSELTAGIRQGRYVCLTLI